MRSSCLSSVSSRRLLAVALTLAAAALPGVRRAEAAPAELVVASESLVRAGPYLEENLQRFLRRIEAVVGWPAGALRGKAFTRPAAALDYIKKNRVPFAILPVHQFVQARRELRLKPLAKVTGLEGPTSSYWGVVLGSSPVTEIGAWPGLRVAATEIADPVWLRMLFEGGAEPEQLQLVEVETGAAAVAALKARTVDVALLYERDFDDIRERVGDKKELASIHVTDPFPAPPLVAVGKFARARQVETLRAGIEKTCREPAGAEACGRMGILHIRKAAPEAYEAITARYERYRRPR
jgi:ABC-type phosphate/phosphonate transport system substrate-binding protein